MDHPKARNEFGLDKDNALDVQKERAKSTMPWVLGGPLTNVVEWIELRRKVGAPSETWG